MQRHFAISIGLAAIFIASGCTRVAPAPAPPAKPKPAVSVTTKAAAIESPTTATRPVVATKPPEVTPTVDQKKTTPTAETAPPNHESPPPISTAEAEADKPPQKPKSSPVRVAILTPGGPLIAEVTLTIDGQAQADAFDDLVNKALTAADTDKDGKPTWKELAANTDYLKTQQVNESLTGKKQFKMLTDQYDHNHDGQVQFEEAAAWLGRDAGVKARSFSVRSSRTYFSVPSAASRVWRLLDADDDGHLSSAELEHCAETLFSLDDDADGVVTSAEVTSLREQLQGDRDRAGIVDRAANPFAALYLEPDFEIDRLEYLLNDLYAPQQDLQPKSFSALTSEFTPLDVNADDHLEQEELAKLLTMKPHLKLSIDFGHGDKPESSKATLTVVEHIPEISVIAQPGADRVALSLGAARLLLSAHDFSGGQYGPYSTDSANASQVRLMVHDQCDPLCEVLDANADGRLGEREIASSAKRLLEYDANKNGQLDNDELPYSMIIAFMRGEQPSERSFYRPQSPPTLPMTADAPAWFVHADFNGDGDVSRREFVGSSERFASLDINSDGFIDSAEANRAAAPAKDGIIAK